MNSSYHLCQWSVVSKSVVSLVVSMASMASVASWLVASKVN